MGHTIIKELQKTVDSRKDHAALSYKENGQWHTLTWKDYWRELRNISKAMISLGFKQGDVAVILGQNSKEWVIADVATIAAGGAPAGIYATSSATQCEYIINHSKASFAFVENQEQLDKLIELKGQLPNLQHVILCQGQAQQADPNVHTWKAFLELGHKCDDGALNTRIEEQKPEDIATLVYTSGTTSNPKAVQLSHENLVWTANKVCETVETGTDDVFISYLPLSHIAEQMLTIHGALRSGYQVYFAENLEKLGENLQEVRPTILFGVPRVWEKIQEKMIQKGAQNSPLKKRIAKWAKEVGLANKPTHEKGAEPNLSFKIANKLVFSKVRQALGLDRCRLQITAAAPISRHTLDFFLSLNIPLFELYGLSECSGPATVSLPGHFRQGKIGLPLKGTEMKIAQDGEILIKGPHVFKGYLYNEEATQEAIDKEGWLHTGDLGAIDVDGYVSITGRKKNLIITAGGENISTEMIESKFKYIEEVEHAVVVGDQQKYLSVLLTLDSDAAKRKAEELGLSAAEQSNLEKSGPFQGYIEQRIEELNKSVARVQTIKKFKLLKNNFSEDSGELTPTLKVKRNVVLKKYEADINKLYS